MTERSPFAGRWELDPSIIFLNHGSFGACPRVVLERQREWRARIERQPVQFYLRDLEAVLDGARAKLAEFVGSDPQDLAFVTNATTGVNAVVRSLVFEPGDELLTTNHAYNACRNVLDIVAERSRARVVVAKIPFPLTSADDVVEAVLGAATIRTRLALLDHVTSATGLVWPIKRLVGALAERGIDTIVDGAHAPGMVPLDLRDLDAAYYTGNCHKWLCAPKSAGFLRVRRDKQAGIHPTTISHGANANRQDRSRYLLEFDWTGTVDPTAYLCVPDALEFMGALLPGGWDELRARNRALALAARRVVSAAVGTAPAAPDEMIGALAAIPVADGDDPTPPASPLYIDALQDALLERHRIEVPVILWPAAPHRLVRVSAQLYNDLGQYQALAGALREELDGREAGGERR